MDARQFQKKKSLGGFNLGSDINKFRLNLYVNPIFSTSEHGHRYYRFVTEKNRPIWATPRALVNQDSVVIGILFEMCQNRLQLHELYNNLKRGGLSLHIHDNWSFEGIVLDKDIYEYLIAFASKDHKVQKRTYEQFNDEGYDQYIDEFQRNEDYKIRIERVVWRHHPVIQTGSNIKMTYMFTDNFIKKYRLFRQDEYYPALVIQ